MRGTTAWVISEAGSISPAAPPANSAARRSSVAEPGPTSDRLCLVRWNKSRNFDAISSNRLVFIFQAVNYPLWASSVIDVQLARLWLGGGVKLGAAQTMFEEAHAR